MTHASQRYAIAVVLALAGHVATAAQPSAAALAGVPRFTRQQMWVNAPDPTYPLAARQNYVQGRGVFQLKIHPQQRTVTRVTILQSTGSKILDDESIRVLSRWRLRRGQPMDRIDHVDVPVTFTLVAPKSSNQSLQPTATRYASTLFMTKTPLEIFNLAPGSRG